MQAFQGWKAALGASLMMLTTLSPAAPNTQSADVERFANVIHHIQRYYLKSVSTHQLLEGAIRGMLQSLDPHSAYLSPDELTALEQTTQGDYGGVGLQLMPDAQGHLQVVSPMEHSPAAQAGLKPGDRIVQINHQGVDNLGPDQAASLMRGKPGSKVHLIVVSNHNHQRKNLDLVRQKIDIPVVHSRLITPKVGYIQIRMFSEKTAPRVRQALKQLASGHLGSLVVDLRDNPGGLLTAAVDTANLFLDANTLASNKRIVYTQGRTHQANIMALATPGRAYSGPMVVLTNSGSASAAEILAGALQDHHRAVLVGERTFGKGSVQTVLPVGEHAAIKLTTALYLTPRGRIIQAKGIIPDVQIPAMQLARARQPRAFRENQLQGHLPGHGPIAATQPSKMTALAEKDFQLFEAIQVLQGLKAVT